MSDLPTREQAQRRFPELAARLDALAREKEPTEPMCVYCGWGGEGLVKHERGCKPAWAVLGEEADDE